VGEGGKMKEAASKAERMLKPKFKSYKIVILIRIGLLSMVMMFVMVASFAS